MSSFKSQAAPADGGIAEIESEPLFSDVEKVLLLFAPIYTPVIGWLVAWVGTHFPGVSVSESKATDLFLAGVGIVVVLLLKFLHSKDQRLGQQLGGLAASAGHLVQGEVGKLPDGLVYEEDLEKLLQSHKDEITKQLAVYEQDVERKLPPNVAQALANVLAHVNLGDLLSGKVDAAKLVAHAQTQAEVQAPPGTHVTTGGGGVGGAAGQTAS